MSSSDSKYDVVIVGGGLAGLAAAILLAKQQHKVLLLEKENYPRHKVCGEYISMESKPFLLSLGVPLDYMHLPVISKLQVTDARGNEVNASLPQGGFGISRFKLDALLADLAQKAGAKVLTSTKVDNVEWLNDSFAVTTRDQVYTARMVCGAWGKRSNIDVKWQRPFIKEKNAALSNYIAVKYHINYPWPADTVGLHNFNNGYCGISQVEDDRTCMCYLTTAANLRNSGNDLKKLEQDVLVKNRWLNHVFSDATFLYQSPVTISQISFERKSQVEDHVLLLGDAAGMITPLCGNGMSMALHAAKLASGLINDFLLGSSTRSHTEQAYMAAWKSRFSRRLTLGRVIQSNFGKDHITAMFLKTANALPFVKKALISGAAGKPF